MAAVTPRVNPEQAHRLYDALAAFAGARRPVTVEDPRVSADVLVRSDGTRFAVLVSQAPLELRVKAVVAGDGPGRGGRARAVWCAGAGASTMTNVREAAPGPAVPGDPARGSVLAVDIGGTKLAAALVRPDGGLGRRVTRATPAGDAEAVWAALAATVTEAVGDEDVAGAGIGSAGPLDAIAGTVSPVNIPAWRGFPVRDRLAALMGGRPAVLAGDAVAAAVGEYRYGAGRGVRTMLGIVVSTGVGGGLILDGRVYAGPTANAGHIGHTIVELDGEPCPCGARGCVETLTSGPAMVRWALRNGWTAIQNMAPDAAVLATAARAGDPVAVAAFGRAARALAAGIASAAALCDLDRVVIGGGVARSWDVLEPALTRAMRDYAGLAFVRRAEVVPSELDGEAAFLGAAALVRDTEPV